MAQISCKCPEFWVGPKWAISWSDFDFFVIRMIGIRFSYYFYLPMMPIFDVVARYSRCDMMQMPCDLTPCGEHGDCVPQANEHDYKCKCAESECKINLCIFFVSSQVWWNMGLSFGRKLWWIDRIYVQFQTTRATSVMSSWVTMGARRTRVWMEARAREECAIARNLSRARTARTQYVLINSRGSRGKKINVNPILKKRELLRRLLLINP